MIAMDWILKILARSLVRRVPVALPPPIKLRERPIRSFASAVPMEVVWDGPILRERIKRQRTDERRKS